MSHTGPALTVERKEKFNFLWSAVMKEGVGDLPASVHRGKLETELEELEVFTQNKNPVNLIGNAGPEL